MGDTSSATDGTMGAAEGVMGATDTTMGATVDDFDQGFGDMGFDEAPVGYAVDRSGQAPPAQVVGALLHDLDLDRLAEVIAAYGLAAVAEQCLRALIADGRLHADEAAAREERERLLEDDDAFGMPKVHEVTVADLADEFTRLGLLEPPPSCRR